MYRVNEMILSGYYNVFSLQGWDNSGDNVEYGIMDL